MRLGGARAYETPLLLDGFNVTDPATGTSSLNLPFEAVRGVDALRDPMAVSKIQASTPADAESSAGQPAEGPRSTATRV